MFHLRDLHILRYGAALCAFIALMTIPALADQKKTPPAVDAYNTVLGTQTIGAAYQFTKQPKLVETAQAIFDMGSRTLKFSLADDKDNWPTPKPQTLAEVIRRIAPIKTVLAMPFSNYLLWAYPLTGDAKGQFSPEAHDAEYKEMYDLTRALLQTYHGTGKTFYLGNWEGDWHLTHTNPNYTPTPDKVSQMIAWINTRQKAVDDAKRDTPHQGVQVYLYLEVNRVVDAMNGKTRMTNDVLPKTNVDFVSYSSYDSLGGNIGVDLPKALDYIHLNYPPSPAFLGSASLSANMAFRHRAAHRRNKTRFRAESCGRAFVGLPVRAVLGDVQQRGHKRRRATRLLAD